MLPEIKHLPVNWVDGMKISKQHFVEIENFTYDHLRDASAAQLTTYNYGLLPSATSGLKSLEANIQCDRSQQIKLTIHTCRAITASGCRIEIVNQDKFALNVPFSEILAAYNLPPTKEQDFYAVLTVNPFERVAVGQPAMQEVPPRHPFARPSYQLGIVPASLINAEDFGAGHLVVGKIKFANGELNTDTSYIPACMSVTSHQELLKWYYNFGNSLAEIETNSFKIIQKIKLKSQKSTLTDSVYYLVEKLLFALANGLMNFKWIVPQQAPIFMVEFLLRLAQTTRTTIDCLTEREKEEILSYLAEWADMTPAGLSNKFNSVLAIQYNHIEIVPQLSEIEEFIKIIHGLFHKLSQLEFIGKRKGQQIFVIESPVAEPTQSIPTQQQVTPEPEKPKSRWSPL